MNTDWHRSGPSRRLIHTAAIVAECGGLDTAFAQRGSTRWLGLGIGADASSRILQRRRQAAALHAGRAGAVLPVAKNVSFLGFLTG
jgi:hypothetical protein